MRACTLLEVMDRHWSDELPLAACCSASCNTHVRHDVTRERQANSKHSWHLQEDGKMQSGESMMLPALDHACGLNKQGQAPSRSSTLSGHATARDQLMRKQCTSCCCKHLKTHLAEVARIVTHLGVRDGALQPQQGALQEGCCASRAAHCLLRVPAEDIAFS